MHWNEKKREINLINENILYTAHNYDARNFNKRFELGEEGRCAEDASINHYLDGSISVKRELKLQS